MMKHHSWAFHFTLVIYAKQISAYFEKFDVVVHFLFICESKYSETIAYNIMLNDIELILALNFLIPSSCYVNLKF